MATIQQRIKREPALVAGVISAVIALAVSFGADLSSEQVGAIMAVVAAVTALFTRQQVTPVAKAAKRDDRLRA